MVRLAWEPMTKSYPWDQPEVEERNTMHIVEYPVTEEDGLNWPKNSGEFYVVHSAEEKNGMLCPLPKPYSVNLVDQVANYFLT
jgi:primary-amine oxidase